MAKFWKKRRDSTYDPGWDYTVKLEECDITYVFRGTDSIAAERERLINWRIRGPRGWHAMYP
jgi:hypothetical protein